MIDAEQSYYQSAIDYFALYYAQKFNNTEPIVYNTYPTLLLFAIYLIWKVSDVFKWIPTKIGWRHRKCKKGWLRTRRKDRSRGVSCFLIGSFF